LQVAKAVRPGLHQFEGAHDAVARDQEAAHRCFLEQETADYRQRRVGCGGFVVIASPIQNSPD
jgi:hypothetical protein